MKNINWNEVPDQVEFDRLTPGGYVCEMKCVVDVPAKEYLKIEYDIAEGATKGIIRNFTNQNPSGAAHFTVPTRKKRCPCSRDF